MGSQNQKSIDIVYVLGKGSNWRDNEIRFSMRSLEKNLKGIRKIWIVGDKPEFVKNITHIPFPDELVNNADGNIIRKVLRVCQEKTLTSNFLFINDDHLILEPILACDILPYHKGNMATFPKKFFKATSWNRRLWKTKKILQKNGYPTLHFDCHVPIVFNKHCFPEVMSEFNFEKHIGYTMKSLYGNVVHSNAPELNGEKVVIFRPLLLADIQKITKGRMFLSINDDGIRLPLKIWLYSRFPEVSKYEKTDGSQDPFFEIMAWILSEEKDFATGCLLYDKLSKAKWVKKYFCNEDSMARDMNLEYRIRELLYYY